jgi:hypothetical protein
MPAMGLSVTGALLDRRELESIFSSRDPEIWERLRTQSPHFTRASAEERKERELALHEILVGDSCERLQPHVYAYVVEAFCHEYGASPFEAAMSYGDMAILPIQAALRAFPPLPEAPEWPAVATLSTAECTSLLAPCTHVLEAADPESGAAWYAKAIRDMCEKAVAAETDLILFFY